MTRRDFLKSLFGASAVALVPIGALKWLQPEPSSREMIIAQTLDTPEGRAALAKAMVEPIKESLMYQAIGQKLLKVEELPQGALARYERDVSVKSHVVARRINESVWRVG